MFTWVLNMPLDLKCQTISPESIIKLQRSNVGKTGFYTSTFLDNNNKTNYISKGYVKIIQKLYNYKELANH